VPLRAGWRQALSRRSNGLVSTRRSFQFHKRSELFIRVRTFLRRPLRDQTHRELVYRPLQFHKPSEHFIGGHDEIFSVTMPSTIQILRPADSKAETQPQLQPALLSCLAGAQSYAANNGTALRWAESQCGSNLDVGPGWNVGSCIGSGAGTAFRVFRRLQIANYLHHVFI